MSINATATLVGGAFSLTDGTGFDDIASARHVRPPLTTVRQPMRDLGEQAVRVLLDRLADPGAPRRSVVFPTELVIRRSCGCSGRVTDKPMESPS